MARNPRPQGSMPASVSEPEFITETVGPVAPERSAADRGRGRRRVPPGLLVILVAMVVAGVWVAGPGRSGAPEAVSLPGYGEAIPWRAADIEVANPLPDPDLRLVVIGLQPSFSASDPEILSIGTDGDVRGRLGAPLFLRQWSDRNPGVENPALLLSSGSLVATGSGRILAQDLDLASELRDLGPGIGVMAGPEAGTVLVSTSANRSLRLVDVVTGDELDRFDVERGRPLDAGPVGIVEAPAEPGGPLTVSQPHRPDQPWRELDGSDGGLLVGLGDRRVAVAVEGDLLLYDVGPLVADEEALTPVLVLPGVLDGLVPGATDRVMFTELTADGRHLAVGVRTGLTDPDRIEIVELERGTTRTVIEPALALGFGWVDDDRLTYVVPRDGRFELLVDDIDGGRAFPLMNAGDLNWWHDVTLDGVAEATG